MNFSAHLIGLTGTNGAGKGETADFFVSHGFSYFSLSDLIREEISRQGKPLTRDNLILTGNRLRNEFGPEILARRVMEKVTENAIIDSIRNTHEVQYLKKQKNFILLAIDAPIELRYQRILKRGRNESVSTLDEFKKKEAEELTGSTNQQQLQRCMQMADFMIINDGSIQDLHRKLEIFL